MKLKNRVLVMGILMTSMSYSIEIANYNEAINVSGKQRMFTQRMLKDYAMVGMNNTFGNPDKDLKTVISQFEDAQNALVKFTKNNETKNRLQAVNKLWHQIKKVLEETPQKEKVQKLQVDLEELLKLANEATQAFVKESGSKTGEIVNISGRQRMLSQRMAGLYMLKVWGIKDPKFKNKLDDSMSLFSTSLDRLDKYEHNSEEIKNILSQVKRSYRFFEMMNKSTTRFIPTLIYKKSNDILRDMNEATIKYTKINKN
jgi:nitrate/nitrite-specific signal transduction histidine kinase